MKKLLFAAVTAVSTLCGVNAADQFISGAGPEEYSSTVTNVRSYAFAGHRSIRKISLPAVTEVGPAAFIGCRALHTVELPLLTDLSALPGMFSGCPALRRVVLTSVDFDRKNFPRFPWGANASVTFEFRNGVFRANGSRIY